MKKVCLTIILCCITIWTMGQGFGFGYSIDMGGSTWAQGVSAYDQIIGSVTQNGFIRFHNASGHRALQLMLGYKNEAVSFQNNSSFLGPDNNDLLNYNADAMIQRDAWKFALVEQFQFGRRPGRLMISINPGLIYEQTVNADRYGIDDALTYTLKNELHPHNFGYTLGAELRIAFLTVGYKVEQFFRDSLDHDFILSQDLRIDNSSELRGMFLNPLMSYIYVGVNLDFYRRGK